MKSMKIEIVSVFLFILSTKARIFATDAPSPHCNGDNPPKLNSTSGTGHEEKIGTLNVYVTGHYHSKRAIVFASDVYGYSAPKLRNLADKIGAAGFYAIVPDFVRGDPFVRDNPARPMAAWLKDHPPEKQFEDAKPVIEFLKHKGFKAIGAVGFCWGGMPVVQLSKPMFIKASVLCHPSYLTVDDIKGVEVSMAILGAERDSLAPPSLLKQFEDVLKTKPEIDYKVKVFPNVSHGWTIRYNDTDEVAVKGAMEAHQDILDWFNKHVK